MVTDEETHAKDEERNVTDPAGDILDETVTGRELLVVTSSDDDLPPRLVIESFEGVDVPFDRGEWRDRTLRLVRRRARVA